MKKTLLPDSYKTNIMLALESIIRDIENLPIEVIKDFWNPYKCRADLLIYLASYLGVVDWKDEWTEEEKRNLCANAILVNKTKGTVFAIKQVLRDLNFTSVITEWWQDSKIEKGRAIIELISGDVVTSEGQYNYMTRLIDEVKRLALHITIKSTSTNLEDIYIAGALKITNRINI